MCDLYNYYKNIQKHLTLILLQSTDLFFFLYFCACVLLLSSFSHLIWDFSSSQSIFKPNSHKTWELPCIHPASVTSFVCEALCTFNSQIYFFLLSLSCVIQCHVSGLHPLSGSNLSQCIPFPDLPWCALGVPALNFCLHKEQSLLQASSQVSFAIKTLFQNNFKFMGL